MASLGLYLATIMALALGSHPCWTAVLPNLLKIFLLEDLYTQFIQKYLYIQFIPYCCIIYSIHFRILSNSSGEFHLRCSEVFYCMFIDVHVLSSTALQR